MRIRYGPSLGKSQMNRSTTLLLVGAACIATATLNAEASMSVPGEECTAIVISETIRSNQAIHRPVLRLWPVIDEGAPLPYEYRDRSRDLDRERKLGRSRDERGEEVRRSTIQGGPGVQHSGRLVRTRESGDESTRETSSGEEGEDLELPE